MNSQTHAAGARSVWNRAVNFTYGAFVSTVRRVAAMVRSDGVQLNVPGSSGIAWAWPRRQVRHREIQSVRDGVVTVATGLDELERILDAHRRDREQPEIQRHDSSTCSAGVPCAELELELTGVWFVQGRRYGVVDLNSRLKHGWFEMYAGKTPL